GDAIGGHGRERQRGQQGNGKQRTLHSGAPVFLWAGSPTSLGEGAASGGPDSAHRTATSAEADIFVNRNFSPAVQSGRPYQGSVSPCQSRKLPLSPGPAAATTRSMPATESATGTVAFSPPMSVRAQPGCSASTTMPRPESALANSAVTMFCAALLMS